MDTSADFSSPTYDFLAGNGANLPNPTDEEYAYRLFAIAQRLWDSHALSHIIGNSRIGDNRGLATAMSEFLPERFKVLENARAVELHRSGSYVGGNVIVGGVRERIFLGYDTKGPLWLRTTERVWDHRDPNSKSGPLSCEELNVAGMARMFSDKNWATPFPEQLLEWLATLVELVCESREAKLLVMRRQHSLLLADLDRFHAAAIEPRKPSGFEG